MRSIPWIILIELLQQRTFLYVNTQYDIKTSRRDRKSERGEIYPDPNCIVFWIHHFYRDILLERREGVNRSDDLRKGPSPNN